MSMSPKLKELAEQQISYYRQHKVSEMVKDLRTRGFVVDDYTALLTALAKELERNQ